MISAHESVKVEKSKMIAHAFRVARFSDEKAWRKFMRKK